MDRESKSMLVQELFEAYGDAIYKYALYMMGNEADARDIVQDVFVKLVRNWEQFRGQSSAKTWLWSIARNCIRDTFRSRHKLSRIRDALQHNKVQQNASAFGPTTTELEDLILRLSKAEKEVVVLRYIQDLSTRDTAMILGWSETKVRNVLHKAAVRLRREWAMNEHGWSGGEQDGR